MGNKSSKEQVDEPKSPPPISNKDALKIIEEETNTAEDLKARRKRHELELSKILNASAIALIARKNYEKTLKMKERRKLIVGEIVATEKTYVQGLAIILNLYHGPLEEARKNNQIELNDLDMKNLFPEIRTIYNYNKDLLLRLQERLEKWKWTQTIGDIFVETIPFLKMYTNYVNAYPAAISSLQTHMEADSEFKMLIKQADNNKRCNNNDIFSFMITPIQRVPRYVMLLEDMLKNTPDYHKDFQPLNKALEAVKKVAHQINESKRAAENFQVLLEIYNQLDPPVEDLVQPHRFIVCRGVLVDFSQPKKHPNGKPYLCLLFNDMFIKASAQSTTKKKNQKVHNVKLVCDLKQITVTDLPDTKPRMNNCFIITKPSEKNGETVAITLQTKTPASKQKWMELIKKHVEKGIEREQSFMRSGKTLLRNGGLEASPKRKEEILTTNTVPIVMPSDREHRRKARHSGQHHHHRHHTHK
mmetsp:Transcript_981/g.1642  ORF Transcript_981/g.1642 Transcript_981/m.1642 type:complete len:473 (-) Transcript_981:595-2013(-)